MTTCGGVNSGKTSSAARWVAWNPAPSSTAARTATTNRCRTDQPTTAWSTSVVLRFGPELLREQQLRVPRHDVLTGLHARGNDGPISLPTEQNDFPSLVPIGGGPHIDEQPPLVSQNGTRRDLDRGTLQVARASDHGGHESPRTPHHSRVGLRLQPRLVPEATELRNHVHVGGGAEQ